MYTRRRLPAERDDIVTARFDGKVAVVTGGASGIGAASSRRLAADGATVVVADLNEQGAKDLAAAIVADGGAAVATQFDQGDEESCRALMEVTVSELGRLDFLHNCAAAVGFDFISRDTDAVDIDIEVWDEAMRINARGYLFTSRYAIPRMIAGGGGAIVNTSSAAGLLAEPVRMAYGASKAAINSLTRHIAVRYGKQGVRCNAIAPGTTITPTLRAAVGDAFLDDYLKKLPSREHGTPEDQAAVVAFLLSDDAKYVNGQILSTDGGYSALLGDLAEGE
jgi:NAD(P)-dependent dehydrogenase (short-subunit alcohol dehydrogenase family)